MLKQNQKSIVASIATAAAFVLLSMTHAYAVPSFGRQMRLEPGQRLQP